MYVDGIRTIELHNSFTVTWLSHVASLYEAINVVLWTIPGLIICAALLICPLEGTTTPRLPQTYTVLQCLKRPKPRSQYLTHSSNNSNPEYFETLQDLNLHHLHRLQPPPTTSNNTVAKPSSHSTHHPSMHLFHSQTKKNTHQKFPRPQLPLLLLLPYQN